jgi:uncharacterized RDD family membrane protein YckC
MYYLWLEDKQTGPFPLEEVQNRWKDAAIHGETLYWREGMAEWQPLHAIHHVIEGTEARMVLSNFWRRSGAFLVDVILLGLAGYISGLTLFDFYMGLGSSGIFLGLVITTLYFGLQDSALGSGQTLGKRIFGIRVVGADGKTLSPLRSILRWLILSSPFWINKALTSGLLAFSFWAGIVLAAVAAAVLLALLYLYFFNRGTGQSLHDLAMGSYVVRASSPDAAIAPTMWRGHWITVGVLYFVVLGLFVLSLSWMNTPFFQRMLQVRTALLATGNFRTATVTEGVSYVVSPTHASSSRICTADVLLKKRPRSMATATDEVAALVLQTDPTVAQDDYLRVSVTYGYDIGIASSSVSEGYARTPAQWKERSDLTH